MFFVEVQKIDDLTQSIGIVSFVGGGNGLIHRLIHRFCGKLFSIAGIKRVV